MFIYNRWYVAALSSEVGEVPLARTILGHPVVLYRKADGTPVALADRCPHRRYPLSLGKLRGDTLECGYHGFTFDCEGGCVSVPGQDQIPSRARVETYPVIQQGVWIWIWIASPSTAGVSDSRSPQAVATDPRDSGPPDKTRLPETPWLVDGNEWKVVSSMAPLAARYELLVDNLLDLSHETYLHAGYIGTPEVAATPIATSMDQVAGVVRVERHMHNVECPTFYARSTKIEGRIDRWQDIEYFAPGYYLLHSRIAPAGMPLADDGSDPNAFHMKISYGITPSTETSTYDFWAVSRDFALDDEEVSDALYKLNETVVSQDVTALDALEHRIAVDRDEFEVSIKIDRGGLAARRLLQEMAGASLQ